MYNIIKICYDNGNYEYEKTKLSKDEINAVMEANEDCHLSVAVVGQEGEYCCIGLTDNEMETIKDNLQAYVNNFEYIHIEKCKREFFVYNTEEDTDFGMYLQRCPNISYLNGWLYGAVQANNHKMKNFR